LPSRGQILTNSDASPLVAAEAVQALITIDSASARKQVEVFEAATPERNRLRGNPVVERVLRGRSKR
jgi:hypothetical protein